MARAREREQPHAVTTLLFRFYPFSEGGQREMSSFSLLSSRLTINRSLSLRFFIIMPPDGPCCAHDHNCDAEDCSPAWSLHNHVATARLRVLNAAAPADASKLLRPWGERAAPARPPLVSDDDDPPELLVHVPFEGLVKITAFSVVSCGDSGGEGDGSETSTTATTAPPTRARLFVNRDDLDFDSLASAEPTQEFELVAGGASEGARVEYSCKPSKFSGVYSVDVHFPGTGSSSNTRVDFLGFKGTHTQGKREAVVAVYESRAMPQDHKVPGDALGGAADVS